MFISITKSLLMLLLLSLSNVTKIKIHRFFLQCVPLERMTKHLHASSAVIPGTDQEFKKGFKLKVQLAECEFFPSPYI